MIEATIYGNTPSKSNCYKIITVGRGEKKHSSLAKTKALKQYEKDFYIQLPPQLRGLDINTYFEFEIDVFYPSQRADLDNSLKVVLDCLQHSKTIRNDNKCIRIVANKALDKINPRIEFKIKTL
jgi:Holliday junction resolvase RusA-like endonuclease